MTIAVDRDRCQGVGMCESLRPEIFEVADDGELVLHEDAATPDARGDLERAVEACPTQALSLTD